MELVRRPQRAFLAFAALAVAAAAPAQGPEAQTIVTVMPRHGTVLPAPPQSDVLVFQGKTRARVTGWEPLAAQAGNLEIYIVLDDDTHYFGTHQAEVRAFIASLPAPAAVGIGYLRNGVVQISVPPTTNRPRALQALRLPVGSEGISPSPFDSIIQLIEQWPQLPSARRVLVMISDGIEHLLGNDPENPILLKAIARAQQGGVIVFGIYATSAADGGEDTTFEDTLGQGNLTLITERTGGYGYFAPGLSPARYAPYFADISTRLQNQFRLTFQTPGPHKPGLLPVAVKLETPNTILTAPSLVEIP